MREKGVCAALFDVYYGASPVSPAAKEGVRHEIGRQAGR